MGGGRGKRKAERKFIKAFLTIAANPVGRVLLYRLLIETRRVDFMNNGCCANGIVTMPYLGTRNFARSIFIDYDEDNLLFVQRSNGQWGINFNQKDTDSNFIRIIANQLDTVNGQDFLDIGLFHEMLHWFQLLRHPVRFFKEDIRECNPSKYMYLSRCYYGNVSEHFTWGGLDHQEMRTILGAPDYRVAAERKLFHLDALLKNDPGNGIAANGGGFLPPGLRFYNGDDLSENAYRMARHTATNPVRMRFGHGENINPVDISSCVFKKLLVRGLNLVRRCFGCGNIVDIKIPKRFRLANLVATNCCNAIVSANGGPPINNWNLVAGEAAQ
jgi:hypothetical protein